VSDVLARDESLVEVFVRCAPHFAKLRNRAMRRVMARLVTVEQAARTANVPVERLVHDLNEALGLAPPPAAAPCPAPAGEPEAARHPASARVVELDVRDDLRSGREPFSKIMAAVGDLDADEVLHLRAIFEPVPLFTVLGKRGFAHESQAHAPDDWSVWFWRAGASFVEAAPAAAPTPAPAPGAPGPAAGDETTTWLDVRGLQPPEPLMRTLAALETLPPGHTLVQVNSRVPQFLFPHLVEREFACEVDASDPDRVLVRIRHARSATRQ
jgi:TusA-related sulfurtransferase